MGRPRKSLPSSIDGRDVYELLPEWGEAGVSQADAAGRLGLSPTTFRKIISEHDPRDRRAADAWAIGLGRRESELWRKLHDPKTRHIGAVIYELKSRFKYTDVPKVEPTVVDARIQVLQMPKALSPDAYLKAVEQPVQIEVGASVEE